MKNILSLFVLILWSLQTVAQTPIRQSVDPSFYPFYHGVASGDPLHDRVIIWTRISPDENVAEIPVSWRIATDTAMRNIVMQGSTSTNPGRDYTVKLDVVGLDPYTTYYYDFYALEKYSLVGRTKTAPLANETKNVRLAVLSCSNYEYGYFNAYKMISKRNDVDAVVHLGDYIYEYETGGYSANLNGRAHLPENEITTLDDYRLRYSHYRLDNDLNSIHQQYAFITVWDDHESADNSYKDGANNHTEGTEGTWKARKASSIQAYMEWMPIREKNARSIYRTLNYGDLLNLYMVDTRIEARDEQAQTGNLIEINDSTRRLLGDVQFNWLVNEMKNSKAQWNVLGQQVMMAPLRAGVVPINTDQWDGYEFERKRLYAAVEDNNIKNFVVLTGDIHTSWANDLPSLLYNPLTGGGSYGVEFVCSSVTSPGLNIPLGEEVIKLGNLHVKYLDLVQKGYLVLDITPERIQSDWYYVDVNAPSETETFGVGYLCENEAKHLTKATGKSLSTNASQAKAPQYPIGYSPTGIDGERSLIVFGIYPNPFNESFFVQFYHVGNGLAQLQLIDNMGKVVYQRNFENLKEGVNYMQVNSANLANGAYQLQWMENGKLSAKTVLKKGE